MTGGIRKLAVICADFPPIQSGEAGHALHLARALARHGIEVHVLTSAIEGAEGDPAFTVHPIMTGWSWSSAPAITRFLRRIKPDGVLLLYLDGMYRSHAMITFLPTIVRAAIPGIRFVTQFEHTGRIPHQHTLLHRAIRRSLVTVLRRRTVSWEFGTLLRDSHHVIALSEQQRIELVEMWPPAASRITMMPAPPLMRIVPSAQGASRARGRAMLDARDDELLVLYYGYMYPGKGIETLMQAMHLVAKDQPKLRLIVAGEVLEHVFSDKDKRSSTTYKNELHDLARNLGITDRITWTGRCSPDGEEGSLFMWASDLCVLPFDKGIQLNNSTFAAAASHGLPILTTRGASLEAPFVQGENVWLCPPRDANEMAAAMRHLIRDPALRATLRTGASALAADLFSWDRAVERTLTLIEDPRRSRQQTPAA